MGDERTRGRRRVSGSQPCVSRNASSTQSSVARTASSCARTTERSPRGWRSVGSNAASDTDFGAEMVRSKLCRVVDTVLIDQDTVYAPCQSNDRLLLGLKGSLNEYELDLLRQRSLSARYEKANRMHPPRQ